MNSETVPIPNSEYNLEEIDGELLLYHPASTHAVYLNKAAAVVWQLCDSNRSVAEIVTLLEENYPESDSIKTDVENTLRQLADSGVIDTNDV